MRFIALQAFYSPVELHQKESLSMKGELYIYIYIYYFCLCTNLWMIWKCDAPRPCLAISTEHDNTLVAVCLHLWTTAHMWWHCLVTRDKKKIINHSIFPPFPKIEKFLLFLDKIICLHSNGSGDHVWRPFWRMVLLFPCHKRCLHTFRLAGRCLRCQLLFCCRGCRSLASLLRQTLPRRTARTSRAGRFETRCFLSFSTALLKKNRKNFY